MVPSRHNKGGYSVLWYEDGKQRERSAPTYADAERIAREESERLGALLSLNNAPVAEALRNLEPTTNRKGNISELKFRTRAVERGFNLYTPDFGDSRCDLVIEHPTTGTLYRIQIKTGRYRNGSIVFNTYSMSTENGKTTRKFYVGVVDYFGVYCPELDKCYLVPVRQIATQSGRLRVDGDRDKQGTSPRLWAADFEL